MSNRTHEPAVPQSIEAEFAVLGSCIIDPEAIVEIADFLKPEHFYRDAHRTLYTLILSLYEQQIPTDFVTLCDRLEAQGTLEGIGGPGYITELSNKVPTSGNVEYYARIVWKYAIKRALAHTAGNIAAFAYSDMEAEQALEMAQQEIYDINQDGAVNDYTSDTATLIPVWNKLEKICEPGQRGTLTGVPSGFKDLDRVTGGFQEADLIVLAARPRVGKTSMAMSIARDVALQSGMYVAVNSLEMSKEQLMQRMLAMEAGVDLQKLRTGWVEDEEWERLIPAMERLSSGRILIDDTAAISLMALKSKLLRLMKRFPVRMLIVDYLQLMTVGDSKGNRVEVIGEITAGLKAIAKECNIPVLALAQLSRAVESRQSKVPQLSDLRESGTIENDADIVLFIYRDDIYNPDSERKNIADLIVAKHRNGPEGEVSLWFEKSQTKFCDLEYSIGGVSA